MFLQAGAALGVLYLSMDGGYPVSRSEGWFHAGSVLLLFLTTAAVSARSHSRLGFGKNPSEIERLIRWNWLRTLLWTAQLVVIGMRRFRDQLF
jgi:hypothetical protein